jgi:hypothetical protein
MVVVPGFDIVPPGTTFAHTPEGLTRLNPGGGGVGKEAVKFVPLAVFERVAVRVINPLAVVWVVLDTGVNVKGLFEPDDGPLMLTGIV